jgi:hypothetical protein
VLWRDVDLDLGVHHVTSTLIRVTGECLVRGAPGRTYCSIVSGVMRLRCGTAWRWPSRARARAAAASGTLARVDSTS